MRASFEFCNSEHDHRFREGATHLRVAHRQITRAVSVGNPREFLQAEKEDQEMAEGCKRLIRNCIICWNCLYLSRKLAEIDDPAKREELLQAMAHGSAAAARMHPVCSRIALDENSHIRMVDLYLASADRGCAGGDYIFI